MTNVTRLLFACFAVNINVFWSFTKKICLGFGFFGLGQFFSSNKTVVTLVTQGLLSSLISRPIAGEERRRVYMLWVNYILGTNFINPLFQTHYHSLP